MKDPGQALGPKDTSLVCHMTDTSSTGVDFTCVGQPDCIAVAPPLSRLNPSLSFLRCRDFDVA